MSEFEKEFSDIAYSYLQTENQDTVQYVVGFEISDYDEKAGKGFGNFVININKKYFYLPVFYIKGQLKPLILLYDKKNDLMYPHQPEWIDYLKGKQLAQLGEMTERNMAPVNINPFNFRNLLNPTFAVKYGSLKEFVKEASVPVKQQLLHWLRSDKQFLSHCLNTHGQALLDACKVVKTATPRYRIIRDFADGTELNPLQKLALIKDGYLILDNRDLDKSQPTYEMEYKGYERTPDADGIYKVPTNEGVVPCIVSLNPLSVTEDGRVGGCLVIATDSSNYTLKTGDKVIVTDNEVSPYDTLKKAKLTSAKDLTIGKKYSLYFPATKNDSSGCFSEPFIVHQKTKDSQGLVIYCVESEHTNNCGNVLLRSGDKISRLGKDLYVPEGAMVIALGEQTLTPLGEHEIDRVVYNNLMKIKVASLNLYENEQLKAHFDDEPTAVIAVSDRYRIPIRVAQDYIKKEAAFFVKDAAYGPQIPNNAQGYLGNYMETEPVISLNPVGRAQFSPRMVGYNSIQDDAEQLMELSKVMGGKIFDDGIMGILSKAQDPGAVIKKYIPDILKSVDKLGKIIFVIWYHGYKVKKDFGIEEFTAFEEKVKDAFINLGTIVLDLHQKDLTIPQQEEEYADVVSGK